MTSHEILKASLLDILFDNRNKQYGAYTLRKYYEHRMGIALGITLSLILFLIFLISPNTEKVIMEKPAPPLVLTTVKIFDPVIEKPRIVQPETRPASQPVTQTKFVANFKIVDNPPEPLPTHTELRGNVIGESTIKGRESIFVTPESPIVKPGNDGGSNNNSLAKEPELHGPTKAPEFPGGVEAWMRFLNKHLNTPSELEPGDKRTVHIRFTVSTDGSITAFEVIRSGGASFDNEVIRVLKKMPKWDPALQNGKPITVQFTQPVTFVSEEE